jgi:hypothetical protein
MSIYQVHTCTLCGNYEEGEDWLVEADSIEDANKKAKHFLYGSWFGDEDYIKGWDGDSLDLDGGERRITIEHITSVTFEEWVRWEIEKQSMGKLVKFKE